MATAKRKTSATRGCKCVQKVNRQLAPQGLALATKMVFDFDSRPPKIGVDGPLLQLIRIDGKSKKPGVMFCAYCPFCGKPAPNTKQHQVGTKRAGGKA